jgi:TolB protein
VVSRAGERTRTEIFVAPLDGRVKRVSIATSCFCQNPSISPDGKHVVYQSCDPQTSPDEPHELFVAKADGTERWNITNNSFLDQEPRWSPDGFHIAFESDRGGVQDIYLTDMNGTSVSKITGSLSPSRIGSWSPDGGALVYWSLVPDSLGATWQIFTAGVSGGETQRLTSGGGNKSAPVYSPGGDSIAYLHGGRIFIMDSQGSGHREIPSGVDSVVAPIAWSLDGQYIFYTGFVGGRSDIYRVKPPGSDRMNLTRLMERGPSHPTVLYDAIQLAFVADVVARKRVYLMDLDGFGKRPLSPLAVEEFGPVGRRPD